MDKTIIGLVAALGAAAPLAGAHAAVMTVHEANSALRASSVAELLEPAPNAVAVLAALDSQPNSQATSAAKGVQVAQWHHHHHHWHRHHHHWNGYGYHHHHHHYRRWCYFHPYAPQCY